MSEIAETAPERGLKRGVLSGLEVLGQSIANIAPTATPTVVIPLVFVAAGTGAWAAYVFAVLAISLVALNINQFARRSASPGNLYSYLTLAFGPLVGIAAAWAIFVAYIGTAAAVTTGFTNYVNEFVKEVSGSADGLPTVVLTLVVVASVALAWFFAYRDVQLSARLMLVLEGISVFLIAVVVAVTLFTHPLDLGILTLQNVDFDGLRTGLVLAIFSFVGFESATSLGHEAKNPLVTIPHAVLRSALFVGAFFVISAYAEAVGFAGRDTGLDASSAPIQDLAGFAGLGWLGIPITLVAIISFFACVLASVTAGARVLYQVGRHGIFHGSVAGVHESNRTPYIAVTISAIIAVIPGALLTLAGNPLFSIYGWVGTTATLSFIVVYAAISVAAPVYLYRRGELRWYHVVISTAAVAFQGLALVSNVVPLPSDPAVLWAVIAFFVFLAAGITHGAITVFSRPSLKALIAADLAAGQIEASASVSPEPEPVASNG
jgi:amino acid transporter